MIGIWGAMSDCSHSFLPWEDGFSKGVYLAGVECTEEAEAPSTFYTNSSVRSDSNEESY